MTREEEILNAAREYVRGITLSSPPNVLHFEAGAKWADEHPNLSSLWQDASEEPQGDDWEVLCDTGECYLTTSPLVMAWKCGYDWEEYVKVNHVQRWLYLSDLFPKGGKK